MATDEDEDVQIISINGRQAEFNCEICRISLTSKTVVERQRHYEHHFGPLEHESQVLDLSSSGESMRGGGLFSSLKPKSPVKDEEDEVPVPPKDKQNSFWYSLQDSLPPSNFTPGLISILKQALLTSHAKGSKSRTIRAALCHEGVVHIGSERWDLGWGCGYRNFLMACTSLMAQQVQPLYFPALDQTPPPGVRNLQHWIEDAWRKGLDSEGAKDLKKLIGTRKWIGTAEVHTAFLSRGIPSRLVDFTNKESCATAVLNWIVDYFSETFPDARGVRAKAKVKTTVDEALRGASPVFVTDRMPLILQHKGHSRTIVGYEMIKDGTINLLCFDPARRPSAQVRDAALHQFFSARSKVDHFYAPQSDARRKHHHGISPSKLFNSVSHFRKQTDAVGNPSSHKKRGLDGNIGRNSKRPRGGSRGPDGSPGADREVIEISDDECDAQQGQSSQSPKTTRIEKSAFKEQEVEYTKVLDYFRLRPGKVGQNDRYQILYFPLEDLLSEEERWARRIVTSHVVQ